MSLTVIHHVRPPKQHTVMDVAFCYKRSLEAEPQRQEHRQDTLQGGAHYLYVKKPYFVMINAGQDSNIVVV